MDGELATPTRLIGQRFAPDVPRLEDRLISFTSENRGLVFQAPLEEVQASFRKVYFGLGAKLTVSGKTYRFWFVRVQSTAGQRAQGVGGGTKVAGFEMEWKDFAPARAAVREWQAALEQPANSGH